MISCIVAISIAQVPSLGTIKSIGGNVKPKTNNDTPKTTTNTNASDKTTTTTPTTGTTTTTPAPTTTAAPAPVKGIVSDFHKEHYGQILFCKATQPDVAATQDFVTTLDASDDISGCVYLEPITAWSRHIKMKIFLNNTDSFMVTDQLTDYTSAFYMRILRKSGSTESYQFENAVLKLGSGSFPVRIEVWGSDDGVYDNKKMIAKGEFTLTKTVKVIVPTARFSTIKAGMVNPTLEQQGLALVNQKATKEGWDEKYTKAKITSTDWYIVKNEYTGAILSRTIQMTLYGVWPDGKCQSCTFSFVEDYAGGGAYGKLQYSGIGDMELLICE